MTNPSWSELPLHRLHGAHDTRIGRRQEPDLRNEEQRGVELPRAVVLREGVPLGVVSLPAHLVVDV